MQERRNEQRGIYKQTAKVKKNEMRKIWGCCTDIMITYPYYAFDLRYFSEIFVIVIKVLASEEERQDDNVSEKQHNWAVDACILQISEK